MSSERELALRSVADDLLYEIGICDRQLEQLRTMSDPVTRTIRDEIAARRGTLERLLSLTAVQAPGETLSSLKGSPVDLYFYPKDDTRATI